MYLKVFKVALQKNDEPSVNINNYIVSSRKLRLIYSRSWDKNYHGYIQFKQVTYFMWTVRYYVAYVFNILETLCKLLMFENVNVMYLMSNE